MEDKSEKLSQKAEQKDKGMDNKWEKNLQSRSDNWVKVPEWENKSLKKQKKKNFPTQDVSFQTERTCLVTSSMKERNKEGGQRGITQRQIIIKF